MGFFLKRFPWTLCALLCLACAACHAELAPMPAVTDPFQRRGFNWGHLRLHPTVSTDFTLTDNSLRAENDTKTDVLMDSTAGMEMLFRPAEYISTQLTYEIGWHDYTRDTAKDFLSHKGIADVRMKNVFVRGLELSVFDTYQQTGNTGALENNLISFQRFASNVASIKAHYDFNRFSISGKYSHARIDYFSRVNSPFDYSAHSGDMEGAYQFIPTRLVLFGSYNITRVVRDSGIENFDTHTILAGARGTYGKLAFSLGSGYSRAMLLSGQDTEEGPSVISRITYAPHDRLLFSLDASRRFAASAQVGISQETDVKLAAAVRLTARGKIIADYTRNQSRRLEGADQVSFAYNCIFEYTLLRVATASASFSRSEREVSSGAGAFVINEGRIGFRLAW